MPVFSKFERRAVIIANYDYKITWGTKGPEKLALPTIKGDIDMIINWLIKVCRFKREEIVVFENPKTLTVKKYFCKLPPIALGSRKTINEKGDTEGGVLQFVYYAGHGCIFDGMTHAIMTNEEIRHDFQPYNLERELRNLRNLVPDVYVFAVFDCCRELMKVLPEKVMQLSTGESQDSRAMADNTMNSVDQKLRNGIFVMCQAGDLVAADSKMMPRIM